ncbi:MAG: hypothetical protein ACJAXQ_001828 [Parvibaculaceae bacterium]|jgi:hypothetical protein|nr:hypothetical protein [Parvibaculaceae bacterium]
MTDAKKDETPLYAGFLGSWILDTSSCEFEQGDAPQAGSYHIVEQAGTAGGIASLLFRTQWVDSEGEAQSAEFSGIPDGKPVPFNGGDLADALSVTAVSRRELNSAAFYKEHERMTVSRQLDDTGGALRLIQAVKLPSGEQPTNISIYRRAH